MKNLVSDNVRGYFVINDLEDAIILSLYVASVLHVIALVRRSNIGTLHKFSSKVYIWKDCWSIL